MARRYVIFTDKVGKYAVYQQWYDRRKLESPILNPHGGANIHSLNLSDKEGLKSCLAQWKGQEGQDGNFYIPDSYEWRYSQLKSAEERIKSINDEFEHHKQQKVNEGKKVPDMPKEMYDRLLMAEAALDIVKEEVEFLEKKLATFTEKDRKQSNEKVLKRGPEGSSKLRDGILAMVDFQKVEKDKDGVLRIAEATSPYHGMRTCDYFELIVRPWKSATIKARGAYLMKSKLANKRGEARPPYPRIPWPERPEEKAKQILTT